MGDKIKSFKDLRIWQEGIKLVKDIYKVTKDFPKEEVYSLSAQMRRAAISVPSNIAEGFRRQYKKEFRQFLNISLGSLAELETQLVIAGELGYLKNGVYSSFEKQTNRLSGMIYTLI